jgi:FdhD protein
MNIPHKNASVVPKPDNSNLVKIVEGRNELNQPVKVPVVTEIPLTIYLNKQEIVTTMSLGDWPDYLAVGFLKNQNMLNDNDIITGIDVDDDLGVVVVRTQRETDYEEKMKKKIQTSGCAQGTQFGDMMDAVGNITLNPDARIHTSSMMRLIKTINMMPSLYLSAGAIHGCVLAEGDNILAYIEDVGRHNAVDKIAGWMRLNHISGQNKIFYTTGRLTSEMVIKTVQMQIPILVSRSGFTHSGVAMAEQTGLTLIGRARGKRFTALTGCERIIDDHDNGDQNPGDDQANDQGEKTSPQRAATRS